MNDQTDELATQSIAILGLMSLVADISARLAVLEAQELHRPNTPPPLPPADTTGVGLRAG